jgi:RNA polymerase sigma-70 factor (ECF subfamily)
MDEHEAIARLKRGDIQALAVLVNNHQVRALRTAYLITQDKALAEDIVQDAFLAAYRSIRQFDAGRPFGPWFSRVVVNSALKAARRAAGFIPLDNGVGADEVSTDIDATPGLDEMLDSAALDHLIGEALKTLSPEHRAVIVLRYYLDQGEADIAAQLKIPEGTVKSRAHTAKRQLRTWLSARLTGEHVG